MPEENYVHQEPAVSPRAGVTGEQNTSQPGFGSEVLQQAKERIRTFKEDTNEYVRKNPTKAVFTALGIGFVLGLMRRR